METGMHLARPLLNEQGMVLESVLNSDIAQSWQRCLDQGLDPNTTPQDCVLSFEKFYQRKQREERYLTLARPEMELLSNQIAGPNYLIAFGDSEGVVLDVFTDAEAETSEIARAIVPGSVWDEDLRGTNALGLVAKHGKRFTVSGSEHFFSANGLISCIAAPIFRSDGNLAGVLDVTSPVSDRERHTATLVGLAAQNISNRLFIEDHRHDLIMLCHPREEYLATQSAGLLAFDQNGRMTGATAMAREILPDIATLTAPCFSDVFQNGYDRELDSILSGATTLLRDRQGTSVFVRIRLTRGRLTGVRAPNRRQTVGLPAVHLGQTRPDAATAPPVTSDDFLKQQIEISAETAAARLPVRVCGRSGSGLSETARAVHGQIAGQDRYVEIDCSSSQNNPIDFLLHGQMIDGGNQAFDLGPSPMLDMPGNVSLILDGIEGLGDRALPVVKRLMAQLDRRARDDAARGRWALIVTERSKADTPCHPGAETPVFDDFWGHSFCVPALANRMDLHAVADRILSDFSGDARLTDDAVQLMRQVGEHLTFYSLRRLIFQLARHDKSGVIDAGKVLDLLPHLRA